MNLLFIMMGKHRWNFPVCRSLSMTTRRREVYPTISEVLETYYAEKNALTRIRQKSTDLRRIVQTALERNVKKYDLQAGQLKDTEERGKKYRVYGGADQYLRIQRGTRKQEFSGTELLYRRGDHDSTGSADSCSGQCKKIF